MKSSYIQAQVLHAKADERERERERERAESRERSEKSFFVLPKLRPHKKFKKKE
jgi:hypothetical protein